MDSNIKNTIGHLTLIKLWLILIMPGMMMSCHLFRHKSSISLSNISKQIVFKDYTDHFGQDKPDSVQVLNCMVGSSCGTRASASSIEALWHSDTILIFEMCGKKVYQRFQTYKFIQSTVDYKYVDFQVSVSFPMDGMSKSKKWYFGHLE
jgi:hypothetical protein